MAGAARVPHELHHHLSLSVDNAAVAVVVVATAARFQVDVFVSVSRRHRKSVIGDSRRGFESYSAAQ